MTQRFFRHYVIRISAARRHPEVNGKLTEAGFEVMATDGPALDRYTRAQRDRWSAFIKRTGLEREE